MVKKIGHREDVEDVQYAMCNNQCVERTKPVCLKCTMDFRKATYPFSVSVRRCVSPSISKIFTVRSDEHVASLRP